MIEDIMLAIGTKLSGIGGYTAARTPIHLIDVSELPIIIFKLNTITQIDDQDFQFINWSAEIEITAAVKTTASAESTLISAHALIHEALYQDRHLAPLSGGVYVYLSDGWTFEHNDSSGSTISMLGSNWTVQYRTTAIDLSV